MKDSVVNIVAILQAHMNSQTLPHKALLSLAGKPLLITLIERIKMCRLIGALAVATTNQEIDDQIYQLCKKENIAAFRGEKKDQLNTDYKIALKYDADVLLKVSMNAPLIDPSIITKILKFYIDNQYKYDYVSNLNPATYPQGNEVEVISFAGLKAGWLNAETRSERENPAQYILNHPDLFRIGNVKWESGQDFSGTHRWLLNREEDFVFIKKVFDELYYEKPFFNLNDILLLLDKKPDLKHINEKQYKTNIYGKTDTYKNI
jgi:spore coat polysaccharide biosynthesis protein SpsF